MNILILFKDLKVQKKTNKIMLIQVMLTIIITQTDKIKINMKMITII